MPGLTFVGVPKELLKHSYGELPVILSLGRLVPPQTPWHATIFETMNMGYESPISVDYMCVTNNHHLHS